MPLRFAAVVDRPASGKVVVVEMDAASVAAIGAGRGRATIMPRSSIGCARRARRRSCSTSISRPPPTPPGDAAFAAALARADGLVALPTLARPRGSGDARTIDALPLPLFRAACRARVGQHRARSRRQVRAHAVRHDDRRPPRAPRCRPISRSVPARPTTISRSTIVDRSRHHPAAELRRGARWPLRSGAGARAQRR